MKDYLQRAAEYCRKNWPTECRRVTESADRIMEGIFLFDGDWERERTTRPVRFTEDVHWEHIPDGDPEWRYMLVRQEYIWDLARAAALTGSAGYAAMARKLIGDFIRKEPLRKTSFQTTWRVMDTAVRLIHWLRSTPLLDAADKPDGEFTRLFQASLREHAQSLLDREEEIPVRRAAAVFCSAGLFMAGAALNDSTFGDFGLRRLEETVRIQLRRDGWQWEQSLQQHNEVLSALLCAAWYARRFQIKFPQALLDAVGQLAAVDLRLMKPNRRQPLLGDSEDSDLRGNITGAAVLLRSGALKAGGFEKVDFDTAWVCGEKDFRSYQLLKPEALPPAVSFFPESGNAVVRSSWSEDASWLRFRCGPLGSGHGHADLLHFDLTRGPADLLVDSGWFARRDCPERRALRSCAAHNTLLVDGQPFTECIGEWAFGKRAQAEGFRCREADGMVLLEGSHLGYAHLGVFPRRVILWLDEGLLLLVDEIFAAGGHTVTQVFHFSPDGSAWLEPDGTCVFDKDDVICRLFPLTVPDGQELIRTPFSARSGDIHEQDTLTSQYKTEGFQAVFRLIQYGNGELPPLASARLEAARTLPDLKELAPELAMRVQIETASGERIAVLLRHGEGLNEGNFIELEGQRICGRAAVVRGGKTTIF